MPLNEHGAATPPAHFGFPVTPYPVQQRLMAALYDAMSARHVGLFESPTGTGKTLSVICAALTWLRRNRVPHPSRDDVVAADAVTNAATNTVTDAATNATDGEAHAPLGNPGAQQGEEPAWVVEQTVRRHHSRARDVIQNRARVYRQRVRAVVDASASGAAPLSKRRRSGSGMIATHDDADGMEDLFADIDADDSTATSASRITANAGVKPRRAHAGRRTAGALRERARVVKVVFATRTHSQLAQFIAELRKTIFCPPSPVVAAATLFGGRAPRPSRNTRVVGDDDDGGGGDEEEDDDHMGSDFPLSVVVMGSRKQMCVNDDVRKLESATAISDRCRELTEGSSALGDGDDPDDAGATLKRQRGKARCPMHEADGEARLKDRILVGAHDIEEVTAMGRRAGACSYYATRQAVADGEAEVVCVPYQTVLHEGTRDSVGLSVDEDTVVIFDEGHNVARAVRDAYAFSIGADALAMTVRVLAGYVERYAKRLAARNLFRVRQVSSIAQGFATVVERQRGEERVVGGGRFMYEAGVDNVNLFEVLEYLRDSRLSQKVRGIGMEVCMAEGEGGGGGKRKSSEEEQRKKEGVVKGCVAGLQRLLECLAECGEFGRVAVYGGGGSGGSGNGRLKHFVVESGRLFGRSMRRARSVLLVGGTLSPRESLVKGLLGDMGRDSVVEFECEHVVPKENVMTRVWGGGGDGRRKLEFTFRNRGDTGMLDALGRDILECVEVVPGGVVIFFASYDSLNAVWGRWKATDMAKRLQAAKEVVVERRGTGEQTWHEYEGLVRKDEAKGATLLAVMGGKLSEGINFADALGRLVMVVGMPFANARELETAEMLKVVAGAGERARWEYLENECVTTVNQSIGRAVRHQCDFASIVLVDARFARQAVVEKLPAFVRRDVEVEESMAKLRGELEAFYGRHGGKCLDGGGG